MKRLTQGWAGHLLTTVAGALITFTLAPFDFWPIGIASLVILAWQLDKLTPLQAALRGWFYGLGLFGAGTSWVYVSIHVYGYAPVPLAVLLTGLFCAGLALFTALTTYAYVRWIRDCPRGNTLGFASILTLGDWFRSWFLTGFPWLYNGYAHIDSPISGWAPVVGILGLNFLIAYTSAEVYQCIANQRLGPLPVIRQIMIWTIGVLLSAITWVTPVERAPIKVAMVQANIPQEIKWNPDHFQSSLQTYERLSRDLWQTSDLVIWPEAAVPAIYENAKTFIDRMHTQASEGGSGFILGLPYREETAEGPRYHNSLMALGDGSGVYHKQRLVPFGEYVPLETWLRGLIKFFDLPMSNFKPGPADQEPVTAKGLKLAPFICYEIVYPDLVAKSAANADLLLTISNDAWFGSSFGPLQHLQMAQMRALENGRYLLRSTGSGITAIIDHQGHITRQGQQFTQEVVRGEAQVMTGSTPYSLWGNWLVLISSVVLCIGLRLFAAKMRR